MARAAHVPGPIDPPTVLVVEDEFLIAIDFEATLEEAGYWVVGCAANCAEAFKILARERVDCVLLDVALPDGDCCELARQLADAAIPFALLTGLRQRDLDDPILRDAPLIQKPCSAVKLLATVAQLLRRAEPETRRAGRSANADWLPLASVAAQPR